MSYPPEKKEVVEPPSRVRLFPLPEHVFLPDLPTPYRVFEPRYRQLVVDLLALPEADRWIAIPKLAEPLSTSPDEAPAFEPIATVGRLIAASPQPSGNFNIVVRGELRAKLNEVQNDKPYRLAEIEALPDVDGLDDVDVGRRYLTVLQLVSSITKSVDQAAKEVYELIESAPDRSTSVYRMASIFLHDADWRQQLLEARRLDRRLAILEDALSIVLALSLKVSGTEELPS